MKLKTVISRIESHSTNENPIMYEIKVSGIGLKEECNFVANRLTELDKQEVSCYDCKHLVEEQDGTPPESRYFWLECYRTDYGNLNGFPFKKIKCEYFEKRYKKFRLSTNLKLKQIFNKTIE